MSIYCEYPGIQGDVTAAGFEGQIFISSFNFDVRRKISMEPGNLANRENTRPSISVVTLTKGLDKSSPLIFKESLATSTGKTVKLHFVRTQDEKLMEYMTFELEDCVVSGFKTSGEGRKGGLPREEITLSYAKLVVSHTQFDKSNKAGSPVRTGYDLAKGTVV